VEKPSRGSPQRHMSYQMPEQGGAGDGRWSRFESNCREASALRKREYGVIGEKNLKRQYGEVSCPVHLLLLTGLGTI